MVRMLRLSAFNASLFREKSHSLDRPTHGRLRRGTHELADRPPRQEPVLEDQHLVDPADNLDHPARSERTERGGCDLLSVEAGEPAQQSLVVSKDIDLRPRGTWTKRQDANVGLLNLFSNG